MSLAFLLQPLCLGNVCWIPLPFTTTTGMPLTLYMDLHPDDWDRAQVTGEVPVGKQGYVRLFADPSSPRGLVSVKVLIADEGLLHYCPAHVLYKSFPYDCREWQVWHFKGCLPLD